MNNMKKEQEEQASKSREAELYFDTNVFVYAAADEGDIGEEARKILEETKNGKYRAFTSTLTIDEILWAIQKELNKVKEAKIAEDFLSMENLEFISVDLNIIKESINNYKESLDPRDAIHLASMQSKKIKTILSTDSDFDKIKGIKRIDFTK